MTLHILYIEISIKSREGEQTIPEEVKMKLKWHLSWHGHMEFPQMDNA